MLATIAKKLTQLLIAIGASMLALMMFLTAVDVGLRYAFNRPLSGAFELVGYMMAILVPFSIAYCGHKNEHITVDLFMDLFPRKVGSVVEIITTFITAIFVIVIAWQNTLYFFEVKASGLTSSVLLIPEYPFIAPVAIAFATFALILVVRLIDLLSEVTNK
jgi:TRAP-type C4-dicarboxylate transport system permease small subunit